MQKFVILTRPRSGSNYLCSRLDGLEDVVCDGELFHPRHIAYTHWPRQTSPAGQDSDSQRIERRNTDVGGFIRARAASVARSAEPRAWGFKHIVEHGGAVIDAIDANSDFRVLCLVR